MKSLVTLDRMSVEYVDIDSIHPNDYNPNRQDDVTFEMLVRSVADDGATRPILVHRGTRDIIDGEHLWRACKLLGMREVPVQFSDMGDAQRMISTLRHGRARGNEDAVLAAAVVRQLAEADRSYTMRALDMDEVEVDFVLESAAGLVAAAEREVTPRVRSAPEERDVSDMPAAGSYRLSCYFSGQEMERVQRVIGTGQDTEARVLELCRAYLASKSSAAETNS